MALQSRRGFTRQPESRNVHILGSRLSKTPPKFHEKTPKETEKERNGRGRGKKRAKFWAVRRRAVRWRKGSGVGWSGAGWSRGVQTNNNHNNHNHNNTNTARNGVWRPTQKKCGPEGWRGEGAPKVGPEGWAPKGRAPSPRV